MNRINGAHKYMFAVCLTFNLKSFCLNLLIETLLRRVTIQNEFCDLLKEQTKQSYILNCFTISMEN